MKIIIYIILFIILILLIDFIFSKNKENFQEQLIFRPYKGTANCASDDVETESSKFKCIINPVNSPVNVNVKIIKYQNFGLFYNNYKPTFNKTDTELLNQISPDINKNYLNYMKISSNISSGQSNIKLLNINSQKLSTEISSLTDNMFNFLPPNIVNYVSNLYELNILNKTFNINKNNSTENITKQFNLYLSGGLIEYTRLSIPYKLDREIVITMNDDNLHIISIQLNQHIISKQNNKDVDDFSSINFNTDYKYLMIYQNDNSYSKILKNYNLLLKDRNIVTDYEIDTLSSKIKDDKYIKYVLIYHKTDTDFGISLVKKLNTELVFINYYDKSTEYSKNICMNPHDYVFKGRCYDSCPSGYTSFGLSCILNDNVNEINNMFNPDSDFCKEVCASSQNNVSNYNPIFQKTCWCSSMNCDICKDSNNDKCNC